MLPVFVTYIILSDLADRVKSKRSQDNPNVYSRDYLSTVRKQSLSVGRSLKQKQTLGYTCTPGANIHECSIQERFYIVIVWHFKAEDNMFY